MGQTFGHGGAGQNWLLRLAAKFTGFTKFLFQCHPDPWFSCKGRGQLQIPRMNLASAPPSQGELTKVWKSLCEGRAAWFSGGAQADGGESRGPLRIGWRRVLSSLGPCPAFHPKPSKLPPPAPTQHCPLQDGLFLTTQGSQYFLPSEFSSSS